MLILLYLQKWVVMVSQVKDGLQVQITMFSAILKQSKEDLYTWSIPDFPATLRLYGKDENSYYTRIAQEMMYEDLLNFDPVNEEFTPRLATHWQISPDKMSFKFRINPNARWADGKPVVADDYFATFKLILDPGLLTGGDEILKLIWKILLQKVNILFQSNQKKKDGCLSDLQQV